MLPGQFAAGVLAVVELLKVGEGRRDDRRDPHWHVWVRRP